MTEPRGVYPYDAWLGFSARHHAFAERLARRLRGDGIQLLTSPAEISAAILQARHLLIIPPLDGPAPPRTLFSAAGLRPLGDRAAARHLIPVTRGGDALPRSLSSWPALDASGFEALERAYPVLLSAVKAAPEPEPAWADPEQRRLGLALDAAQAELDVLNATGSPPETVAQVEAHVRQLRRELRDQGDLVEGYILGGRYRLLDALGVGGFASVWRAWDRRDRGLTALKVLHAQHARDGARVERFFHGAAAMQRPSHPHVARILEPRGRDGGHLYYAMELCPGGDLERRVLRGGLSFADAVALLAQVGGALHHAHEAGAIHRDVKPSNVLLAEDGTARLTDFDLLVEGGPARAVTTGTLGTFLYAAPEQIRGGAHLDARADVYGLGMTALFALHGTPLEPSILFEREAFIDAMSVPEAVKAVLLRAVMVDPAARYNNVAAFVGALLHAAE